MKRIRFEGQTWRDSLNAAEHCPVQKAVVLLTYTVYNKTAKETDLFACAVEALDLLGDQDTLGGWFWKFGLPPTVPHLRWIARCIALGRGYLLL